MASSSKLPVNIETLKWARENAGFTQNDVPDFDSNDIKKIEKGKKNITLKEANTLANNYGVSIHIFSLPPKVSLDSSIKDFRKLPDSKKHVYSKELRLFINKMKYRQEWMRDYLKEENVSPLSFIGSVNVKNTNLQSVAEEIVKTFFQSRQKYFNFFRTKKKIKETLKDRKKTKEQFLNDLIKRLADYGIITLKCKGFDNNNKIDLEDARGFVLIDKYVPFIFINSSDHITAQIFTLMHEIVHIFIGEEGVSGNLVKNNSNQIELFCNQVASRILLPEKDLNITSIDKHFFENKIRKISTSFFISKLSVLLRLKEISLITSKNFDKKWNEYQKDMKEWIKTQEENKEKNKERNTNSGNYYNTAISRRNRQFIKSVYGAYQHKSITASQALSLLDVNMKTLKKLYQKAIKK